MQLLLISCCTKMTDILYHNDDEIVNDATLPVRSKQSSAASRYNPQRYQTQPTPVYTPQRYGNNNGHVTGNSSDAIQYHSADSMAGVPETPQPTRYTLFQTPQSSAPLHAPHTISKHALVQQLRSQMQPVGYQTPRVTAQRADEEVIDLTDDTVSAQYNERKRKYTTPLMDGRVSDDDGDSQAADETDDVDNEQQRRIEEYKRLYNIVDIPAVIKQSQLRQERVDYEYEKSQKQHAMYMHQQTIIQRQVDSIQRERTSFNFKSFDDILSEIDEQQRYDTVDPVHALIYADMLHDIARQAAVRAKKTVPLTVEQQDLAQQLIRRTPSNFMVAELSGIEVKGDDMKCLSTLAWLNDEVINLYLKLLQQRCDTAKQHKVWFYNTFFYAKLAGDGAYNYNAVRRWSKTQKVDITALDMLIVPVHVHGNHWTLARLDFRRKRAEYYDSLRGSEANILRNLRQYVIDEAKTYKSQVLSMDDWQDVAVNAPRQSNGSDCGVFSLMFANYLCDGLPVSFTYTDMPYFRQRIALEIKHKQIV